MSGFDREKNREERSSAGGMVLTVTEDTPADMLAGSMELLVQLPTDHHVHTQRVTVPRSTPMMDLLVQIATAHKLGASNYTLQAIGQRGLVLPHQPNTPIGALDALQVKLLPKQGTFLPRKTKQANQPFETTFRLQVLLPRNQLYVSRVSPKMNLGKILDEVCREKNLDKNKYELRHPANLDETLDLSLSLQDYHLQEVTLYAKQGRTLGAALSSQDIMALQRQEERRRQQAKQSVFGFMFRKSKESSLSIDSLGGRSVSPARSDETGRSVSPLAPPPRPLRKRRPAPKPPVRTTVSVGDENGDDSKEKIVISHSRNSSDSSGYHEASVLSDNPESNGRMPETLPRRSKPPCKLETSRKLAQTSQASKSLGNLAVASGGLGHGISTTSINSTGVRKKRVAPPPPPIARPLSSAISTQALERIVDSEESLTSDIDISKSPSDIAASSKANSDIGVNSKANSDIGVHSPGSKPSSDIGYKIDSQFRAALAGHEERRTSDSERRAAPAPPPTRFKPSLALQIDNPIADATTVPHVEEATKVDPARVVKRESRTVAPIPKPRSAASPLSPRELQLPVAPRRLFIESASSDATTLRLLDPNEVETHITGTSTDGIDEKIDVPRYVENNDSPSFPKLREKNYRDAENPKNTEERSRIGKSSTEVPVEEKNVRASSLKHVKSVDDIHGLTMEIADENISATNKFSSGSLSCAIISTIPKCVHLTPNIDDDRDNDNEKFVGTGKKMISIPNKEETSSNDANEFEPLKDGFRTRKRAKVFRSQSATNDFAENSFEKHARHLTSHPESFTCALNPNFSRIIANNETETSKNDDADVQLDRADVESTKNSTKSIEDYPPFVINGTNWNGSKDFAGAKDDWAPQVIEQSANGDRTTETDILLQKVSDTLSNSLPSSASPTRPPPLVLKSSTETETIAAVPTKMSTNANPTRAPPVDDDLDGLREKRFVTSKPNNAIPLERSKPVEKIEPKSRESILSENNIVNASTPNATINSQQDTSDYVSATGDDLSITDWEYQLPAPPSAFRDDNSPVFDDYDAITPRAIEITEKPIGRVARSNDRSTVPIVDSPTRESPIPPIVAEEIGEPSRPAVVAKPNVDEPRENPRASRQQQPKLAAQISTESRTSEASSELKKEIINELANKIENGGLPQSNGRTAEQEFRRTTAECAAPKIAPADNTLSNFTITTYSRPKSLNIFEEENADARRSVSQLKNSDDKVIGASATIAGCKSSTRKNEENFGSKNTSDRTDNVDGSEKKLIVNGAQSVERIAAAESEFERPSPKFRFTQHDSLSRRQSMNTGNERSNVVHRSKSYVNLPNNSKYREIQVEEEPRACPRNKTDDGAEIAKFPKSTSVTNLNRETPRTNEKFSQWRENILKRQEEPSKEKQLQSLQVLQNILPQLKNHQHTEKDVVDSSSGEERSHDAPSQAPSEADQIDRKSSSTPVGDAKPAKPAEDGTAKRYKYAGPPAISLGSWSERPRVNVQLKKDTDYKFGGNDSSGPKTVVSLNRTTDNKIVDDRFHDNSVKSSSKHDASPMNDVPAHRETAARSDRWDSNEDGSPKKITNYGGASVFKKPSLNRIGFPAPKTLPRTENKPVVTSVALKKTNIEITDSRSNGQSRLADNEDDVKIDTKPVNFKELAKTFGQEVCLRAKPKRVVQNRHSDYYGTRPDVVQTFSNGSNGSTNFRDSLIDDGAPLSADCGRNHGISNGSRGDGIRGLTKRYTSIVGIPSTNGNNRETENGDSTTKCRPVATAKTNGPMPVVKGFKIQSGQNAFKTPELPVAKNNGTATDDAKKNGNVPPPPPTMPVITGVTLKNSTARPKSIPVGNVDTRDQLLESIRSFGGRDKLKSLVS